MKDVIADADVLPEKLLPYAVVEAGSLVLDCGGRKIVKHEPDQIQNRRRFQNHRVPPRGQLRCLDGEASFFASSFCQFLRMNLPDVCAIRLGPACRRIFLHGNGKLRMRFAVGGEQTARIAHRRLALSARKDSRRHLSFLGGPIASESNRARPLFGSECRRCLDEAIHGAVPLLPRHRQKPRISRLAVRQRKRGLDRSA